MGKIPNTKPLALQSKENFITRFLERLTGHARYIPDIVWSENLWTHNIFRLFEMIFGRKYGIRLEISLSFDGKVVREYAHTFEGACALTEVAIRKKLQFFKDFSFDKVRVFVPQLQSNTGGFDLKMSPYLFAIAYDASSKTSGFSHSGSNPTYSHTCTGSDRLLTVDALDQYSGVCTGITYNSVSLTSIGATSTANQNANSRYLIAPATGSNTVSVSYTTGGQHMWSASKSYTGVDQTSPIDAYATKNTLTGATVVATVTVVAANCWVSAGCIIGNGSTSSPTITSDRTTRQSDSDGNHYMAAASADSNGTVSAGSYSITFTESGASEGCAVIYSIAPMTSVSVTVNATVVSAAFSIPSVTVTAQRNVTVSATVQSAAFSIPSASVSGGATVSATVQSASFSIPTPQVTTDGNVTVSASVVSATFSTPAPTVTAQRHVQVDASVVTATFSTPAPAVSGGASVMASVVTAVFSTPAPTITAQRNVSTTASVVTATFSVPSVTVTVETIASPSPVVAVFSTPSVTITAIRNITVSASVVSAVFSLPAIRKAGGIWTPQARDTGVWTPTPRSAS